MEKIVLELKDKKKYIGQYVKYTTTVYHDLYYAKVLDIKDECLISNVCWCDEDFSKVSFFNNDKTSLKVIDEIEIISQEEFNEWLHGILKM